MSEDWADRTAQELVGRGLLQRGICLLLGAADTGKTTLAEVLAKRAVSGKRVGIIDADIGQSHIGPPTTVGWAMVDDPQIDFSQLAAAGISFVGDVTPVGHLLQLTGAIVQAVRQVSQVSELIIIDTPGLVYGPAAAVLWWTVQQIVQPELILAVQREQELSGLLSGLRSFDLKIEAIKSPPRIRSKSPEERRRYRQSRFAEYFQNSKLYDIRPSDIAVQPGRGVRDQSLVNRLVALRNGKGIDVALGVITGWQEEGDVVVVKAPNVDMTQIRCLVIGDVTVELPEE
jgi:polynucleotide 5'-hydroxyl-kinase GRC3/NOL9